LTYKIIGYDQCFDQYVHFLKGSWESHITNIHFIILVTQSLSVNLSQTSKGLHGLSMAFEVNKHGHQKSSSIQKHY